MTEAAPDHTDPKHNLDELFQLLVHARGVLPDTKAKAEILSALQRGDLQVDSHIRGGARSVRRIREPTPEQSREFEALSERLHRRKASEKEMREAVDRATAFLYEHAPPEGITGRVHRESWEPDRVFSLTIKDDRLNVLSNCALDYSWTDYSFTIANWWMVDELWPLKPPAPTSPEAPSPKEPQTLEKSLPSRPALQKPPREQPRLDSKLTLLPEEPQLEPAPKWRPEEAMKWLAEKMASDPPKPGDKNAWAQRYYPIMQEDFGRDIPWSSWVTLRRRMRG